MVAVQLLGRAHRATTVTGSVTVESDNVIDVVELAPRSCTATTATPSCTRTPPPPPDHRARNIAIGFVGAVATGVLAMAIGARLRRAR
ncbi:hypothetical protein B6F63_21460 [Mycobacterium tuberculosis variant bovis]|nr:hypothetical protein B6F63_21460 [Mycobacterium tuberculosis variant bovis]